MADTLLSIEQCKSKPGEYCATTSQCSPGFQCCAYCPPYSICGPDTEFKPYCRWGSCEERKNYVQFTDDDLIFL
ncbi:unnamed protein product, partial [Mesorhabditis belari]|uniref:Uncharacterized protein n=1 Tax=Mesorhabditis belari TaxID=2138241 RepID=A0AAF3J8D8_9BILA